MTIAPMFVLDAPHYHMVTLGATATFRGVALAPGEIPIAEVVAYRAGEQIARTPVDIDSSELSWVPVARSSRCRFSFDLAVERGAPIELHARYADGREVPVFMYDIPFVERDTARLAALGECVRSKPAPPSDVIAATQGIGNLDAYRASTATSFVTMRSLLQTAGARPSRIRSILDVGCGTGRLLVGWHCDDPRRELVGTDINRDLIAWSRSNLADVARWEVNAVRPPLDLAAGSFDLVILASVLTHLALGSQKAWLEEIHRLLRPAGHALITLHGAIYAGLVLDEAGAAKFDVDGYVEKPVGAEGANGYSTFHAERFARALFSRFSRVTFFPRGVEGRLAHEFPVASLQDVYVLTRGGEREADPRARLQPSRPARDRCRALSAARRRMPGRASPEDGNLARDAGRLVHEVRREDRTRVPSASATRRRGATRRRPRGRREGGPLQRPRPARDERPRPDRCRSRRRLPDRLRRAARRRSTSSRRTTRRRGRRGSARSSRPAPTSRTRASRAGRASRASCRSRSATSTSHPTSSSCYAGVNDLQPAGHVPFAPDYSVGHADDPSARDRASRRCPCGSSRAPCSSSSCWAASKPRARGGRRGLHALVRAGRAARGSDDIPAAAVAVYERNLRRRSPSRGHTARAYASRGPDARVRAGIRGDGPRVARGVVARVSRRKAHSRGLSRYDAASCGVSRTRARVLFVDAFAGAAPAGRTSTTPVTSRPAGSDRFATPLAAFLTGPAGPLAPR